MTVYVSNQAGEWQEPTIWVPNLIPGTADTVSLRHAITEEPLRANPNTD